jgi:hypothetical protein
MGSYTRVRFKGIVDFEISGYPEENIVLMKKILKYAYISSGAQDSCISNTFNGFNQLAFNLMKLYQEASETESPMKHSNGETIPFSNSIYMHPVGTLGSPDWLIYEGDNIPMAGWSHSSNAKWHREMSFLDAKSIKMEYTKYHYDEETDKEWSEDITFDSIGYLYEFKQFFYKRWNELHCATELDMKKKYSTVSPKHSMCHLDIYSAINNSTRDVAERFAKANLLMAEKYLENKYNKAEIYNLKQHYGFKISFDRKISKRSIKQRVNVSYPKTTFKSLIVKYLSDKRWKKCEINSSDNVMNGYNNDGSYWFIIEKSQLNDNKMEYILNKIYGG